LFVLGRRIRGPTLGVVLAYAWASYPFTLWSLSSNTNDTLVAVLVIAALLVLTSAPARGVAGALAGLTKFGPLALAPLLMRGLDAPRRRKRSVVAYVLAYGATIFVAMLPVLLDHNLHAFWRDTVSYQAGRVSPFSIWGLWGGLSIEQHVVQVLTVLLGCAVAILPRQRDLAQVGALGAATMIALQLGLTHWFYLYIPWFFPLLGLALIGSFPSELGHALTLQARDERSRPALAGAAA
jgi:hypothetical protein